MGDKLFGLDLDIWDEGWDYYFDPENFMVGFEDENVIKEQIKKAIQEENYELANSLRKKLDKNI